MKFRLGKLLIIFSMVQSMSWIFNLIHVFTKKKISEDQGPKIWDINHTCNCSKSESLMFTSLSLFLRIFFSMVNKKYNLQTFTEASWINYRLLRALLLLHVRQEHSDFWWQSSWMAFPPPSLEHAFFFFFLSK